MNTVGSSIKLGCGTGVSATAFSQGLHAGVLHGLMYLGILTLLFVVAVSLYLT